MSHFMSSWLNIGLLTSYAFIAYILIKWGNIRCIGVTPLRTPVFMAILFTSGLEVGGIMLPLIDFPVFEDTISNPEYSFTNPLAMEFASMGFAIWSGYFMMCFYFCVIEPKVRFFEIPFIKFLNTVVISLHVHLRHFYFYQISHFIYLNLVTANHSISSFILLFLLSYQQQLTRALKSNTSKY